MKERLVEDWLIRINERGYEVAFCQILLSKGFRVIRCGHSPTEHGKDVLAIAPDGSVHAYQLKTGDFAQSDVNKHHDQLNMLVETRPIYPGLPASFEYRPFLVTTGEFKEPAISLIAELNESWECRKLPRLGIINGRQLHVDLVALSSDFWPIESPEVRLFRELYLVDGRGDLDVAQYARFLMQILSEAKSSLDLERRVSAANIFASYLLEEFSKQDDNWSVFHGWTICAAQIACAGESANFSETHWRPAFDIAKGAALRALADLGKEVLEANSFSVRDRELDELTRARNTVALASAACSQLIGSRSPGFSPEDLHKTAAICLDFLERGRLSIWGEGAASQFLMLYYLFEYIGKFEQANAFLMSLIEVVSIQNENNSENPLDDPYSSPDEFLTKIFTSNPRPIRRQLIESYCLFPLVLIAVRRNLRGPLEKAWRQISRVNLTWFEPAKPSDQLKWHCENGKEMSGMFTQPQTWKQLCEIAYRDRQEYLPQVIRDDLVFGLLFMLAFPHRFTPRLIKHLDSLISRPVRQSDEL
jgi:hypothetical protein